MLGESLPLLGNRGKSRGGSLANMSLQSVFLLVAAVFLFSLVCIVDAKRDEMRNPRLGSEMRDRNASPLQMGDEQWRGLRALSRALSVTIGALLQNHGYSYCVYVENALHLSHTLTVCVCVRNMLFRVREHIKMIGL